MDPKLGLNHKGNGESPSKWTMPSPQSYKPDSAPAKPGGGGGASGMAKKTANTPSGTKGLDSSMKSRY